MTKVSIIIPIYNTYDYIGRCLNSAVKQTLDDIEIICVNDCSTDNSVQIVKNYMEVYKNVVLIDLQENKGAANARNVAIEIANGEYIGFIDSDDYVDFDYFKTLYEYSIGNDYDVIRGIRVIDEACKHGKNEYGCIVPSIIRRQIFLDHPNLRFPTNLKVGEDSTFKAWLYRKTNKIFECPDTGIYYHYMRRAGSLSNYNITPNK